jgi:hypothetical protein
MRGCLPFNMNMILILSLLLMSCHIGGNINNVDYKPKITEPLIICLDKNCKNIAGPSVTIRVKQSKSLYFTMNPAYNHKLPSVLNIEISCNQIPLCPFIINDHPPCSIKTEDPNNNSCELVINTENSEQGKGANIIATIKELKDNKVSTFISLI